ncbi:DNA endonuclease [Enterococcus phage EF36P1]|nr:DNA endonuclease [Enterococcus phage EF36P1]WAX14905.1 DNA endonuclease [Enterococcus phage EF36P2]WAX14977.1 DNA endonuclease [Enterococcus phage EF36P3]
MEEVWKDVAGYEGLYQVSNLGRVKRATTGKVLKGYKNTTEYLGVNLCKNGKHKTHKIHRLVAQAFIPNPENKPQVNHIDEDKTNNMASNLEWMTAKENSNHGTRNERISIPIIANNLKTGEFREFYGSRDCARQLGLNQSNITDVLKGRYKQTGGYVFEYAK